VFASQNIFKGKDSDCRGMRVSKAIIIFSLLLFAVPSVLAVTCANDPNFNSLVCGSQPISALGYGAVDVCGLCYPCGASDGVCPEDFYSSGAGRGSCRFCPDPDCANPVEGFVEDTDGNPVEGASVVVVYGDDIQEEIGVTDAAGFYSGSARSGFARIFVNYADFDSRTLYRDIARSTSVQQVDFVGPNALQAGSCRSDCTNLYGSRCQASCNGVNGCLFASFDVAVACDGKEPGTRIFIDENRYYECCAGDVTYNLTEERFLANPSFDTQAETSSDVEELVTYVQRTRNKGEGINVHVVVWDDS
jgi:hypothetical protein